MQKSHSSQITPKTWHQQKRKFFDKLARITIAFGGVSIIFAIVLIFFYLLWVVFPIFQSASVESNKTFQLTQPFNSVKYIGIEESGTVYYTVNEEGEILFFDVATNQLIEQQKLTSHWTYCQTRGVSCQIDQIIRLDPEGKYLAALVDNHIFLFNIGFAINFSDDVRIVSPKVRFPFNDLDVSFEFTDVHSITGKFNAEFLLFVGMTKDKKQIEIRRFEQNDMTDEWEVISAQQTLKIPADYLLLNYLADYMFVADKYGHLVVYHLADLEQFNIVDEINLTEEGVNLTSVEMLLGGISVVVADTSGDLSQWLLVRDENQNHRFTKIRNFLTDTPIQYMIAETRRKGIIGVTDSGMLSLLHMTAHRELLSTQLVDANANKINEPQYVSLSPRSEKLAIVDVDNKIHWLDIHNPHPEISWKVLWSKIWYESYSEPNYIWQSSSADSDFEPKFSLVPLTFGTLKAAFYAMLFAVPIAIMGAIFTAYFMAPKMRQWVKPSIEIMEALPTVILGFLAGLFLAPLVEKNLLAVVSMFVTIPIGMLTFAWFWQLLPKKLSLFGSNGWHAALLIPVVMICIWLSFMYAPIFEVYFFGGDIKVWMLEEFGIGYDQRNSLVVGLAMGLAVIPTIFSITEDAIYSVPSHLTQGSLALGATPWQTLIKVVILTASPGIFSAVMIGFGRAVGETMIVLMATGNTPVMDFSIFQGMRTLSANIAVELPESEVNSSHYRILFLAALVLFLVTFLFNTLAEVIRQRLRKRYSNL